MKRLLLIIFLFCLLSTACTPTTTETVDSEPAAVASTAIDTAAGDTAVLATETVPPPVVTVDTPRVEPPTAVPEATELTSQATDDVPEPEPLLEEAVAEASVISGRTEEGAFFLGDPNAPIVHIDYSDFL